MKQTIIASCHCGDTKLELEAELPTSVTRCTCTFCSKRGALWAYFEPAQVKIAGTPAHDAVYRWQSKMIAHHFCDQCGCTTFSDSPAFTRDGTWDGKSRRIGVNARLIDGFDAATAPVTVIDGRNLW